MEYEYSFKVTSLSKYISYCINNNYEKLEESAEIRTLYFNKNKRARLTTKSNITYLDFKEDLKTSNTLKVSKETIPLKVDNIDSVNSILEFLEYKKDHTIKRKRAVYKKNNVIFELDSYTEPIMLVVAIEGLKEEVDLVYKELSEVINETSL